MRPAPRAGASLCLLLACLAPASLRDGGADRSRDMLRLYLDCDHALRSDDDDLGAPRPRARIASDVALRRSLEAEWRTRFAAWGDGSLTATAKDAWRYPLEDAVSLIDNYTKPTGSHEALDIFVGRPGVEVRAPTAGVVVAAGDDWRGGSLRRALAALRPTR